MSRGPRLDQATFADTFPIRFASAMDHAKGVMAGLQSGLGREGVAEEALARLHEIYRLRVELELETAGVLWRTAEIVCALTDAATALADQRGGPGGTRALLAAEDRRKRAGFPPRSHLGGRPELAVVNGTGPRRLRPVAPQGAAAVAAYPRAA